jgi:hypothetical protein
VTVRPAGRDGARLPRPPVAGAEPVADTGFSSI